MSNRIKGFKETKARTAAIPVALKLKMKATVQRNAEQGAALAARNAPRDSGDLAASIHVESRGEFSVAVVAGDKNVDYAPSAEFGNEHQDGQPFFFPAMTVQKKRYLADLRKDALRAFKEITGR